MLRMLLCVGIHTAASSRSSSSKKNNNVEDVIVCRHSHGC